MAQSVTTDGPRSRRQDILDAAVLNFGRVGYEHTKWATVATEVGVGQTALYHYFESKAHCLLTIMAAELQRFHERFTEAVAEAPDSETALRAGVASAFDLSEREALQARILLHHFEMLSSPRSSVREEEERGRARDLVRAIERDWISLLAQGMDRGEFPRRDEVETGRFVLGLINSVWSWYRPTGRRSLQEIADSVTSACLRVVG